MQVLIKETVPQEVQAAARQKSAQFWHQQQQSTQQTSSEDNLFIRTWHAACHLIGNQPAIRTMVQASSYKLSSLHNSPHKLFNGLL